MQNSSCSKITIDAQWFLFYAPVFLLVPIQWVFGWIIASLVHELGHYIALKLFKVQIAAIKISIFGARIITEPISHIKEAFCALAGPAAGLCTLFAVRQVPYIALSGVIQSGFNLIPVYPLDGGRALRCILLQFLPNNATELIMRCISMVIISGFVVFGMWISITYALGILPILFPATPIILAVWKNSLQRGKKNSTIR